MLLKWIQAERVGAVVRSLLPTSEALEVPGSIPGLVKGCIFR